MAWIYSGKLYDSEFQAGCLAARMREEGFILSKRSPRYVYVFKTKTGRYGVKCMW
ncbi:MAG: hypothetical protein OWR52_06115 [Acidibacillus sp.]|uniref:Uncharacterized protein n=1 Tax=Sulfoacidibacillus ferrooxidans TaxID=2005001 RepID=A0A9X2AFH6_9BACL|nr:hypothetical protein [Sulfoacidibacillus ferrooxidans]MCI0184076.1 hypothetical protein [Sulfoacidibacillus ferrooxidans]MCY0893062.1 hypothetical protein [Acidibacillus sp.]